jgi:CRISPR system Cascade subunit CasD
MHVRVDRRGKLLQDWQTAGAGRFRGSDQYAAPKSGGSKGKDAILLQKHYLQDASFLVALEGDRTLLERLAQALQDPVWPPSLGRRSCPPAVPVLVGLRESSGMETLHNESPPQNADKGPLRLIQELPVGDFNGEGRPDIPLAWPDRQTRRYAIRYVHEQLFERSAP